MSINEPAYPAARAVAERVSSYFSFELSDQPSEAVVEDPRAIEEVISAAFWASLRREEGRPPMISLAMLPPEVSAHPLMFEVPIPLEPRALARLAPAVERPGIHLGVWWRDEQLLVWGTTRSIPTFCFVLEVVGPGLLVAKYRRNANSPKFTNIAVLEGENIKFMYDCPSAVLSTPRAISELLQFYASAGRTESDTVLVQIALSMRAHARGGTLLVVAGGNNEWQSSIVQPILYAVSPYYSELSSILKGQSHVDSDHRDEMRSAVDVIAGLTAVDGATIISDGYELIAFGAKISRKYGSNRIERVVATEPIEGAGVSVVEPSQFGGTRHLSAAQFVHDQRDAAALVASQDGRFTVFAWSDAHDMVHAHRLESLLM